MPFFSFLDDLHLQPTERVNKGKSRLDAMRDFVAVDLETTGLSPAFDEIIELAAVRYRGGKEVASYSALVNPGWEINSFITDLTGITNEMLADQPQIEQALPPFIEFIGGDIVVGHNVSFDVNFLYDNCERVGLRSFSNDFIDTMRISRRLHKDWPNHKLDTMLSNLWVGSRDVHRAENDARLTAQAYLIMASDPSFASCMAPKKRQRQKLQAKEITAANGAEFDEDSPFFESIVVFTGTLEHFSRREAMQIVANIGGICEDRVTQRTNYLILGNNDYCSSIKGGKSNKQKKAEKYILEGADLKIIPESVFLDMLALDRNKKDVDEDLPNSVSPEAAFERIRPALLLVLKKNWVDCSLLSYEERQSYSSVLFDGGVVLRIRGGKKPYIDIPDVGIAIPGSEKKDGYFRVAILDNASVDEYAPVIEQVLQSQIDSIPKEFSCCSRYLECSDSVACINPDKEMAMHCGYRKVLMSGKVFYGKNRNV